MKRFLSKSEIKKFKFSLIILAIFFIGHTIA